VAAREVGLTAGRGKKELLRFHLSSKVVNSLSRINKLIRIESKKCAIYRRTTMKNTRKYFGNSSNHCLKSMIKNCMAEILGERKNQLMN